MITGALEAITSRKWLVEAILFAVVAAAIGWACHHLIETGVERQKIQDQIELAKVQRDADFKTGLWQGRADAAHETQEKEHAENLDYQRTHPLHGGLCLRPGLGSLPKAPEDSGVNGGPAPGNLQPVSAGDSGPGGQSDPDVRHLLDVLDGKADEVSSILRECQSVLPATPPP